MCDKLPLLSLLLSHSTNGGNVNRIRSWSESFLSKNLAQKFAVLRLQTEEYLPPLSPNLAVAYSLLPFFFSDFYNSCDPAQLVEIRAPVAMFNASPPCR